MKTETRKKLRLFHQVKNEKPIKGNYKKYEYFLKEAVCGEGMVGKNSYLVLWGSNEIEELNNDYAVQEFLSDIILIGSDGGNIAYGLNMRGEYIEVPFIGMNDDSVKMIAKTFDEFITYLWNKAD